jgi:small conductance mechanosensitive channel
MIRAWVPINDYWDVYWDQMRKVKVKIEAAGFHIPFPQRDLHITGGEAPFPAPGSDALAAGVPGMGDNGPVRKPGRPPDGSYGQ